MDADAIWEKALTEIKSNINQVGYNVYIKDIVPISLIGDTFTLAVSMNINKNMIEKRYMDILIPSLTHAAEYPLTINIIVSQDAYKIKESISSEAELNEENEEIETGFKSINQKYTFDTFVIGPSNEYAHAASLRTANNPGYVNPLFLYGNSGLGKTHLMCAIGNHILKEHKNFNIIYVSSEKFTNDFIDSLKENKTAEFRKIYRNADVLLIDDIQFLAHKEQTQEEFFHTFEELSGKNKQIVITSDRMPQELVTLEDRLRTRFSQGYIVDITTPNYETRVAILQKKAEIMNYSISPDILSYIAERIKSNIRELEGALIKVVTQSEIKNHVIDIDFAEKALSTILPSDGIIKITPEKIIEKVCIYYSIKKDEILSDTKKKNIAVPRQIAMYLCKELTNLNFVEMTSYFKRDRTTIMHNVEKISTVIESDKKIKTDINYIKQDIQSL